MKVLLLSLIRQPKKKKLKIPVQLSKKMKKHNSKVLLLQLRVKMKMKKMTVPLSHRKSKIRIKQSLLLCCQKRTTKEKSLPLLQTTKSKKKKIKMFQYLAKRRKTQVPLCKLNSQFRLPTILNQQSQMKVLRKWRKYSKKNLIQDEKQNLQKMHNMSNGRKPTRKKQRRSTGPIPNAIKETCPSPSLSKTTIRLGHARSWTPLTSSLTSPSILWSHS